MKFGSVEFFKIKLTKSLGDEAAWENRTVIYLVAAACAETIADIFLCPFEAVRIRAVSDPTLGNGLLDVGSKMVAQEGVMTAFYSGFGPPDAPQAGTIHHGQIRCAEEGCGSDLRLHR